MAFFLSGSRMCLKRQLTGNLVSPAANKKPLNEGYFQSTHLVEDVSLAAKIKVGKNSGWPNVGNR